MKGVTDAECVYVGGRKPSPTYRSIKDYTEGVIVTFDPSVITYTELLGVFFSMASPHSCSTSTQYRQGIWWHSASQEEAVAKALSGRWKSHHLLHHEPVTDVYRAEEYHQRYFAKNGSW